MLSLSLIKSHKRKDKHRVFVLHSAINVVSFARNVAEFSLLRGQYTPRRRKSIHRLHSCTVGLSLTFPCALTRTLFYKVHVKIDQLLFTEVILTMPPSSTYTPFYRRSVHFLCHQEIYSFRDLEMSFLMFSIDPFS